MPDRRSASEKRTHAGILFNRGDIIRTEGKNGKGHRFLVKVSGTHFLDKITGDTVLVENIADQLLNPRKTRKVNQADVLEYRTANRNLNMRKRRLLIDTETAIKYDESRITADDIYQVAYKIKGTKKTESFVFTETLKRIEETRNTAGDPRRSMMNEVRSLHDHASKAYKRGQNTFRVGGQDHTIIDRRKFWRQFEPYLNPEEYRMQAFHSTFDKQKLETLGKAVRGGDYSIDMDDIRGSELARLASIAPEITPVYMQQLANTNQHLYNRMNFSRESQNQLIEAMRSGVGDIYSTGTKLEDLYHTYRYTLGRAEARLRDGSVAGDYITQSHGAASDVNLLENVQTMGDKVEKLMKREKMGLYSDDLRRYVPTQQRLAMGMMRTVQARMMVDDPSTPFKNVAAAYREIDRQAGGRDDPASLAKRIRASFEFRESAKIEKGMFKGMKGTLGGPGTVSALLAGASLAAGIRWTTQKAEIRKMRGEDEISDGMSHNSLMTIARRISLTDFGSTLGNVAAGSLKTIGLMFGGSIGPTREALKEALAAIMSAAKGSAFATKEGVKQMSMGNYVSKNMEHIFKKFSGILDTFGQSVRKSDVIGQKIKETVSDFFGRQSERVAAFGSAFAGPTLKKEGERKFIQSLSRKFITKDGKMTMYSMAALGGMGGSLMLAATAGKYDPDKVPDQEEALNRGQSFNPVKNKRTKDTIAMRLSAIRYGSQDGIQYGSADRQMQRYSKTDFGSGRRRMATSFKHIKLNDEFVDFKGTLSLVNEMTYNGAVGGIAGQEVQARTFDRAPTRVMVQNTGSVIKNVVDFKKLPNRPNIGRIAAQVMDDMDRVESTQTIRGINEQLSTKVEEIAATSAYVDQRASGMGIRKQGIATAGGKFHTLPDSSRTLNAVMQHKRNGAPEAMFELQGISNEMTYSSRGIYPMHQMSKQIKAHVPESVVRTRTAERRETMSGKYQTIVSTRATPHPDKRWMADNYSDKTTRSPSKHAAENVRMTTHPERDYFETRTMQEKLPDGRVESNVPNQVSQTIVEHLKAGPGAQATIKAIPLDTYHTASIAKEQMIINEQLLYRDSSLGSSFTREGKVSLSGGSTPV